MWGLLRVLSGTVTFVLEDSGEDTDISAGGEHVIAPGVAHHVVLADDARFLVEFHRVPD